MWAWAKGVAATTAAAAKRAGGGDGGGATADAHADAHATITQQLDLLPPLSAELLQDDDDDDFAARRAAFADTFVPHGYAYPQGGGDSGQSATAPATATATTTADAFDALLSREYAHVRRGGLYLDYAGAAPYAQTPVRQAAEALVASGGAILLRNPHSAPLGGGGGGDGDAAARAVEALRAETLKALRASPREYAVVLTSGATGALKLLAEAFPWNGGQGGGEGEGDNNNNTSSGGLFAYARDSHTSIVGVREEALRRGASAARAVLVRGGAWDPRGEIEEDEDDEGEGDEDDGGNDNRPPLLVPAGELMTPPPSRPRSAPTPREEEPHAETLHLLAVPAECNFSGHRASASALRRLARRLAPPRGAAAAVAGVLGEEQEANLPSNRRRHRWFLVLDAAKAFSTSPPDLSTPYADAVALSFYKACGHPTGFGALVVRRSTLLPSLLRHKAYFGGGTVEGASSEARWTARRQGVAGLEDGTPAYTLAQGAALALAFLRREHGWGREEGDARTSPADAHASCLSLALAAKLLDLRHSDGSPVARLYLSPRALAAAEAARALLPPALRPQRGDGGDVYSDPNNTTERWRALLAEWRACQGPTVAFNLLLPSAAPATDDSEDAKQQPRQPSWIGHSAVRRLAGIHGVALRTGCFCNPGACEGWLGLTAEDAKAAHAAGRVCWGDSDATADGSRPDGAVRASLGPASAFEDVWGLVGLIRRYFVDGRVAGAAGASSAASLTAPRRRRDHEASSPSSSSSSSGFVRALYIYPVKSCGAQAVGGSSSSSSSSSSLAAEAAETTNATSTTTPWPLSATGLAWDRAWAVVGPDGAALTQRAAPALATVRPVVDLAARTLTLWPPPAPSSGEGGAAAAASAASPPLGPLVVPLPGDVNMRSGAAVAPQGEEVSVCGEMAAACGARARARAAAANGDGDEDANDANANANANNDEESAWWRAVTGLDGCRLVALASARTGTEGLPLSFANEGQLLVVNEASVAALQEAARERARARASARRAGREDDGNDPSPPPVVVVDASRFRPNVVLAGFPAWAEDGWAMLNNGGNEQKRNRAARVVVLRVGGGGGSGDDQGPSAASAAELVPVAPCARCDLVRVDQRTGRRGGAEALAALADPRLRQARGQAVRAAVGAAIAGDGGGDGEGGGDDDANAASFAPPSSGINFGVLASSFACWNRWVDERGERNELPAAGAMTMMTMTTPATPLEQQRPRPSDVGGAGARGGARPNAVPPSDPSSLAASPRSKPHGDARPVKFTGAPAIAAGDRVEVRFVAAGVSGS